jgi:hypothetical protein
VQGNPPGGFDGKLSPPGAPADSPLYPRTGIPPFGPQPGEPPPITFYGPRRNHPLAVASLSLGISALATVCCCQFVSLPVGIAAVVCGILGLERVKVEAEQYQGQNLCIAGIVLGAFGLLLGIGMLVLSFTPLFTDALLKK